MEFLALLFTHCYDSSCFYCCCFVGVLVFWLLAAIVVFFVSLSLSRE
jgi:hypothetical protein